MIDTLEGVLTKLSPTHLTLKTGGIGYELAITRKTAGALEFAFENPSKDSKAEEETIELYVQEIIKEDSHTLYGFFREEERVIFRLLVKLVSGVGPAVAMAILAGTTVAEFQKLIETEDSEAISKIKGIGIKTAQKIVLELREKIKILGENQSEEKTDPENIHKKETILALLSLGYRSGPAQKAVETILAKKETGQSTQTLLKNALQILN